MVNRIDILHKGHGCNLTSNTGGKAVELFRVVLYHHEIIVEWGEYGFDSFAKSFVNPCWRMPVFFWFSRYGDFKNNICCLKEILLNLGSETSFVFEFYTVAERKWTPCFYRLAMFVVMKTAWMPIPQNHSRLSPDS